MKTFVALLVLATSFAAHAGQETHGGNVVVCSGKDPVMLDYYHAALPTLGQGNPKLVSLDGLSPEQVIAAIRERLVGLGIQARFDEALEKNGPVSNWIATDLRAVDDSAEPYVLPKDCKRVTAAIRQGDVMYVDAGIFMMLSPEQQGLLLVHEALYRLSGENTSANVRNVMRIILRESVKSQEVVDAVHLIGSYYLYETLSGFYDAEPSGPYARCSYTFYPVQHGRAAPEITRYPGSSCPLEVGEMGALTCSSDTQCMTPAGCSLEVLSPVKVRLSCGMKTITLTQR